MCGVDNILAAAAVYGIVSSTVVKRIIAVWIGFTGNQDIVQVIMACLYAVLGGVSIQRTEVAIDVAAGFGGGALGWRR